MQRKKKIAIGSFNTPNLESLQAVIEAAEELKLPVIIQFAQCHEPWIPLDVIGPIMVEHAKKSKVPVCVHLDHGETLKYLQRALDIALLPLCTMDPHFPMRKIWQIQSWQSIMASGTGASDGSRGLALWEEENPERR